MKKVIYYFLAIVIGNALFLKFYANQDIYRMFAFFALLALVYAIPIFSTSLSRLLIDRDYSDIEIHTTGKRIIKKLGMKSAFIAAVTLILMVGLHAWGYWNFINYQNEDLSDKGIYSPAIVTDKKLESKSNHLGQYYIYYKYRYNGQVYMHCCPNNTFVVGDTIVVKFSPNNPDHHIVTDKKF